MDTPTVEQAVAVREAVTRLLRRSVTRPDDPVEVHRAAHCRTALNQYLNHPAAVEEMAERIVALVSLCEYKIYWTRDGTPANQAWRDLFCTIDTVLDPQPTPGERP